MPDPASPLVFPNDIPGFVCVYRFARDGTATKLAENEIDPRLTEGIPWSDVQGGFWFATIAAVLSSVGTWLFLRHLDRG